MTKAFERELRGPSLLQAQGARNQVSEDTIGRVNERNQQTAQEEYEMALDQERQARTREAAQQQSMLERQEEMEERQADFTATVSQMSKLAHVDRDRWWASRSTPQKIAGFIELALSGFSRAPSMIMKRIDDDVKAQEFAFYATRDTAQAKQTAFSMAMQKYQNADAARAVAAAAGREAAQAQLAAMGAKWKGTEAANKADIALAALQDEKMMQIANGIQFVPSQYRAAPWIDPKTGLIYSEHEAHQIEAKLQEQRHANQMESAKVGGQLLVEGAKSAAQQAGKADEGAHQISNQLQQAGVPQARALADRALAALNKSPGGVGEAALRGATPGNSARIVLSEDANAREQAYSDFMNAAMKLTFGNVTASEEVRAAASYGSTGNPEARKRSIQAVLNTLEEVEKNAKAGASPAAQAEFERRREVAKGDKPAAPPSADKGWGK
jgi:hypothetical protein